MRVIPGDYQYDVFISYKRNPLIGPWVTNHLLQLFSEWLREKLLALGEEPKGVFYDQRDIEPGERWPGELRDAIRNSKVLVAVCSPSYFHSPWCMSEWQSFREREQTLNISGLRIPLRHNDSERFLNEDQIQFSDFYGYTFLADGYYQSAQATEFEKRVESLAVSVANAIHTAPPFQSNWPVVDGQPYPAPNPQLQRL